MVREWLKGWLPSFAHGAVDWLFSPGVLAALSTLSIVFFIASVLGIPWLVARLPEDYFCERRDRPSLLHLSDPRMRVVLRVIKNAAGVILLLAGLAMLVLPGQGIITMLASMILLDFPAKRRLLGRIVARPHVLSTLNRIRRRANQPPLEFDP